MTPGSIRGVRKKKCMQAHRRPRFPRPYLTVVLSPFARHHRSPSLSIYQPVHATTDTVAPPPLSTQGHPNAFPPPTTTRPPPVVTALPPMASPAQQRQPSTTQSKGVIGPFKCMCVQERMHVRYTYASSKIIEKILGESGVADVPLWRRRHRLAPGRRRVPPSFSSSPPSLPSLLPGVCFESICNSLSLSRVCVATLHATFSTQPTRREIGNLKSKLRTTARRAHPRPSFSRITLDHPVELPGLAPNPGVRHRTREIE